MSPIPNPTQPLSTNHISEPPPSPRPNPCAHAARNTPARHRRLKFAATEPTSRVERVAQSTDIDQKIAVRNEGSMTRQDTYQTLAADSRGPARETEARLPQRRAKILVEA